jgi:hypothetical protein
VKQEIIIDRAVIELQEDRFRIGDYGYSRYPATRKAPYYICDYSVVMNVTYNIPNRGNFAIETQVSLIKCREVAVITNEYIGGQDLKKLSQFCNNIATKQSQ